MISAIDIEAMRDVEGHSTVTHDNCKLSLPSFVDEKPRSEPQSGSLLRTFTAMDWNYFKKRSGDCVEDR